MIFTLAALVAFAANSILCRLALQDHSIDAASFSAIRLSSGAAVLLLLVLLRKQGKSSTRSQLNVGNWPAAVALFTYAAAFSFSYLQLTTGTGALILFGTVQVTLILLSLVKGHRIGALEWTGLVIAFAGLVYLVWPGASAPSLVGFVLMLVAGMAWGIYTWLGRGSATPLLDTAGNFTRTLPMVVVLLAGAVLWQPDSLQPSSKGVILAILSGALASGMGYALWYRVLPRLSATEAAVLQLSVPILAALGGLVFVDETISLRLMIAAALVLSGIGCVIYGRR